MAIMACATDTEPPTWIAAIPHAREPAREGRLLDAHCMLAISSRTLSLSLVAVTIRFLVAM